MQSESEQRSALQSIKNSGFSFPDDKRVIVNLLMPLMVKGGAGSDQRLSVCLLICCRQAK